MALLVTDQGEIDSLRTLLNSTHTIPRNLVLKLYTSNTTPGESDVPSSANYYEPYNASNASGYGSAATTGYPVVANNRTEENQDFTNQYGILLNGNRWTVATTVSAVTTQNATGTAGTYQIAVGDTADIKKGDYAEGAGIPANTYVVDIQGLNLEISQQLTADMTAVATNFGRGRSTASYPEQVFTFTSAAGNVYGYYLSRANNMPVTLQGVADGGSVAAGTTIAKTGCKGVIGYDYINLLDVDVTPTITSGTSGTFEIAVDSATSIAAGQRVSGTGIAAGTTVVGVSGTSVYLSKALTGAASGTGTFKVNVAENLTPGMAVSQTATPNGVAASTVITGIDYETVSGEIGPRVYISNALVDNIQVSNGNDQVKFDFSIVTSDPGGSAVDHELNVGDVIYIAGGTTNTITDAHYTVFETPTSSTFTTTPALQGTGDATLYASIFFAERFTNGPYAIQNNGDQIKVTLNVSLD
tara:strand:- start:3473 stop:4885 length:1413 start_codon:yes stop_codon:yes gene_type:complete